MLHYYHIKFDVNRRCLSGSYLTLNLQKSSKIAFFSTLALNSWETKWSKLLIFLLKQLYLFNNLHQILHKYDFFSDTLTIFFFRQASPKKTYLCKISWRIHFWWSQSSTPGHLEMHPQKMPKMAIFGYFCPKSCTCWALGGLKMKLVILLVAITL